MKSAKCHECGFVGWANAEFCKKCGAAVVTSVAAAPAREHGVNDFNEPHQLSDHQQNAVEHSHVDAPQHAGEPQQVDESVTYYYPANVNPFPEELRNGWAISSLVSGILNFLLLTILVLPPIAGIIISAVALKKIKRQPLVYGGHGMAVGGLVLNIVSAVALIPVLMIAAIAIPNLLAARRAANEGSAINALRTIHSAEATWQATKGNGKYGSLFDLYNMNLISPELAKGERNGYKFNVELVSTRDDGLPGFEIVGVPTEYGATGRRSFFIDETGVIRGADARGMDATKYDPPLGSGRQSASLRDSQDSSEQ